ncbi:MAG TPA: hypothetical protein VN937_21305 [Blastocatellia bacterium]|nr:hypothetical protein [Blastocatellia bacterium]
MTICVAVKVPDGLVLAADSRVLSSAGGRTLISDEAEKIQQIGEYPIGLTSWGLRRVNDQPIESLLLEFSGSLSPLDGASIDVFQIAVQLIEFITPFYREYQSAARRYECAISELYLFIGGYSTGNHFPDVYRIDFIDETIQSTVTPIRAFQDTTDRPAFGFRCGGETGPLERLIRGADQQLVRDIVDTEEEATELYGRYRYSIRYKSMPLKDAIDLSVYLANVVTGICRFKEDPISPYPVCGGEIDVAVITETGFRWDRRKEGSSG